MLNPIKELFISYGYKQYMGLELFAFFVFRFWVFVAVFRQKPITHRNTIDNRRSRLTLGDDVTMCEEIKPNRATRIITTANWKQNTIFISILLRAHWSSIKINYQIELFTPHLAAQRLSGQLNGLPTYRMTCPLRDRTSSHLNIYLMARRTWRCCLLLLFLCLLLLLLSY